MKQDLESLVIQACQLVAQMARIGGIDGGVTQTVYSIKGASQYLGMGETTFRGLIKKGEIPPAIDMNGLKRWHRSDLDRYVEKCMNKRKQHPKPK